MGKIVCEVCGAAYPETSSRCPVCGSVRYSTPEPISDVVVSDRPEREESRPTGGRYANANVKKRRKRSKKNAKLIQYIAVGCALILLLILLITLLFSSCEGEPQVDPTVATTEPTEAPTEDSPVVIPCEGITLNESLVNFTEFGQTFCLTAVCDPLDTTDQLVFVSSDISVVTVDEDGNLEAIAPGIAYISVTCGDVSVVCEIVCTMEEETEPPTLPPETLVLNRTDFTLSYKGATWQLYSGVIDVSLITFTSENEAIATIKDGKVTAVGRGTTKVYAEFGDQKVSCIVRCSFKSDTTTEGNGGVQEDNGTTGSAGLVIYSQFGKVSTDSYGNGDISIKVGDKVQLTLSNGNGTKITVDWSANTNGIVSIDGKTIIGDASGSVILTAVYEGKEYKCIVRVK